MFPLESHLDHRVQHLDSQTEKGEWEGEKTARCPTPFPRLLLRLVLNFLTTYLDQQLQAQPSQEHGYA